MSALLKSMLNNFINDRHEEATMDLHNYMTQKMRTVSGLAEAVKDSVYNATLTFSRPLKVTDFVGSFLDEEDAADWDMDQLMDQLCSDADVELEGWSPKSLEIKDNAGDVAPLAKDLAKTIEKYVKGVKVQVKIEA